MEQQSYLSDIEFNPVFASPGQRFLNYLIDVIIFYVIIVVFLAGLFYSSGETYKSISTPSRSLLERLVYVILFVIFYTLCEIIFNGRTIGKFITGTKAVNEDGTEIESKTIFLRSLSRIVPFEPFSALGNPSRPWHDKWTRTYVIDIRKTALNNPSLQ